MNRGTCIALGVWAAVQADLAQAQANANVVKGASDAFGFTSGDESFTVAIRWRQARRSWSTPVRRAVSTQSAPDCPFSRCPPTKHGRSMGDRPYLPTQLA